MKRILALAILLLPIAAFSQQHEISAIGTKKGAMMIYNYPNSRFTIRIEGERVRATPQKYVFLVDNRALQLVLVDLADVSNLAESKSLSDSLKAHALYEINYLRNTFKQDLTLQNEQIITHASGTFMFWTYTITDAELATQLQITFIVGDKLLILKTASKKEESVAEYKAWLEKFASSVVRYSEPIDFNKLIEAIKKE